jgi:hypothetical protein
MEVLRSLSEVCLVDTVVHLVAILGPMTSIAKLAFVLQHVAVTNLVFSWFKHVIAFGAKAHSFELGCYLTILVVLVHLKIINKND